MKIERKPWRKFGVSDVVIYFVLALIVFIMMFPFWNAVVLSFNEGKDAMMGGIYFWPRKFTLANYSQVFQNTAIWQAFGISVARTVLATVLSLVVTSMFAYSASKPYLKFRRFYMVLLLIAMFFNGGIIPTFLTIRNLGLINNFLVYILPGMFNAFYAQIFISFFRGLPESLFESARIDGAREFKIYSRLVLPLSKPVLAAVGLFTAVFNWNAWYDNMLYVKTEGLNTLSFLFVKMIKAQETMENLAATSGVTELANLSGVSSTSLQLATMMIAVLPIMLVYPFVQKYFATGMMIGSVKG